MKGMGLVWLLIMLLERLSSLFELGFQMGSILYIILCNIVHPNLTYAMNWFT